MITTHLLVHINGKALTACGKLQERETYSTNQSVVDCRFCRSTTWFRKLNYNENLATHLGKGNQALRVTLRYEVNDRMSK